MNTFTVITLFPELVDAFGQVGIVRRALESGNVALRSINPRTFTPNGRGAVDDSPYGGGPGMVMMVTPLREAIKAARQAGPATVAYMTPQGRRIDQQLVAELSVIKHLVLVAGRYEGIDERVIEHDVDLELSLGDFVMSGGEVAALALIDAVVRLLPGSLGSELSAASDSFSNGLLEHAQYTRPECVDQQRVPRVLLSGNHAEIEHWRRKQALSRTWLKRPDLVKISPLSDSDRQLLSEIKAEIAVAAREQHGED
jgi:tRNA (guanine37-N1)-methyltransferase